MRLLVTRPVEDAAAVADDLRVRGHEPVLEPLLAIEYADGVALPEHDWAGVLATSANAVRALSRLGAVAQLKGVPLCAVGGASAGAAREAGFADVLRADGDLEALVRLVAERFPPGSGPFLYAAGETVSGDLKGMLEREGYAVERVVLYAARPARELSQGVCALLASGEIDGVLLFSPRTARIWAQLVTAAGLAAQAGGMPHLCLSRAVAVALGRAFAGDAPPQSVAAAPDMGGMLALVDAM